MSVVIAAGQDSREDTRYLNLGLSKAAGLDHTARGIRVYVKIGRNASLGGRP